MLTQNCNNGSLKDINVKGEVVFCERGMEISRLDQGKVVKAAGGAATLLVNQEQEGFTTYTDPHVLPASHLSYAACLNIKHYINTTSKPIATVKFKGTVIGNSSAPMAASFSSRGPSSICPGILKPDIIGLVVSILAASPFPTDKRKLNSKSNFNVMSGTSMSCPHLSGIAALLKSSHPDWSPAAIKSAIMTTAEVVNQKGQPITDETLQPASVFAIGTGHPNPSKANDLGLVYDIKPLDYIPYLCGKNYTDRHVGVLLQGKVNCSLEKPIPEAQLNYPSFSVVLGLTPQTYTREVTDVGKADSSYAIKVAPPQGISVSIKPKLITFSEVNQKAKYAVTFRRSKGGGKSGKTPLVVQYAEGSLTWVSDQYSVRSPIAVKLPLE